MKLWNKLTIRVRITLTCGVILALTVCGLTYISTNTAKTRLIEPIIASIQSVEAGSMAVSMVPLEVGKEANILESATAVSLVATRNFNYANILSMVVTLCIGLALIYITTNRALRPVEQLTATVGHITEENLRQRLPEPLRQDEIGKLTGSFNDMMDRLEDSFSRQKRFSANVAHELKTPLTTMSVGIQVLKMEDNPTLEEYRELLQLNEDNVARLSGVVDDLMALCYESGELEREEIQLADLCSGILKQLSQVYIGKDLNIQADFVNPVVIGNKGITSRGIFNLVENAMKYTPQGGTIKITSFKTNDGGGISISNTGAYIPPDQLERIFEPFYRVEQSRSRKIAGAGLGLSIVKTIVERQGWSITGRSDTASTCFTINW